jgi:hypothetical protein
MKFSLANANLNDLPNNLFRESNPVAVAQIALGDEDTPEIPVP